jgi:hypothetical protein
VETRIKRGVGPVVGAQDHQPYSKHDKSEIGSHLFFVHVSSISVARLLPWNTPGDYPILEDEIPEQPLVLVGSTGDLMDPGSESEEDSGPAMVDDPEDQTFEPSQAKKFPVGSNPAKKSKEKRPLEEPKKAVPGVLSRLEIPDTAENRLLIGHGAKRNAEGKIFLEQRLVPQTGKRRVKPVNKLDL